MAQGHDPLLWHVGVLSAKKLDPQSDTSALEAEIDQLVYKLYNLTPEEIAIVEGKTE